MASSARITSSYLSETGFGGECVSMRITAPLSAASACVCESRRLSIGACYRLISLEWVNHEVPVARYGITLSARITKS